MSIKRTESGWIVDAQPGGRAGQRVRKTFKTLGEARRFAAHIKEVIEIQGEKWNPKKADTRKISDLIEKYDEIAGFSLKDQKKRISTLKKTFESFNENASEYRAKHFLEYRFNRTTAGISASTVNNETAYAKAMFNALIKAGEWIENPLTLVSKIKKDEFLANFLSIDECKKLIENLNTKTEAQLIAKISLTTGCRFSEAHDLQKSQINEKKITFSRTKSKKLRTIPISAELESDILEHAENREQIFDGSYDGIYDAIEKAIESTGAVLPKGQNLHVLRHSFASHFVMRGGNILVLQKILGHSSVSTTMRYAHTSPEHLEEAMLLNPIS